MPNVPVNPWDVYMSEYGIYSEVFTGYVITRTMGSAANAVMAAETHPEPPF